MKKECVIAIPVYSKIKKNTELIAIKQAMKIFKNYDLIAVTPMELDLSDWKFTRIERFENSFFESTSSYNRLMLSVDFYRRFTEYEFILIYQLDAYVFEDRLAYFCNTGYDYIGAPWLYGVFNYTNGNPRIMHVGNGGLSLRRVSSFIQILDELQPLRSEQIKNEDLFFSAITCPKFKIAPLKVALQFAFERQVRKCYELNGNSLPFGCHAWQRYDLDFWKKYFERDGYSLDCGADNRGNEDITRQDEYKVYSRFSTLFEDHYYNALKIKQRLQIGCMGREIIIFGAGLYGKNLEQWLESIGISVRGFCDNNNDLVGKKLDNCCIWSAEEISSFRKEIYVIIANYEYENDIAMQLNGLGLKRKQDYLCFSDFVDYVTAEFV